MTAHDDGVKLALLEQKVDQHETALKEDVFPRLTSLDLWRQRIIGGMAVIVSILIPVLIAALKYLSAPKGAGP